MRKKRVLDYKFKRFIPGNSNGQGGSNILTLECGHTISRKASVNVPDFAECETCPRLPRKELRLRDGTMAVFDTDEVLIKVPRVIDNKAARKLAQWILDVVPEASNG